MQDKAYAIILVPAMNSLVSTTDMSLTTVSQLGNIKDFTKTTVIWSGKKSCNLKKKKNTSQQKLLLHVLVT